MDMITSQKGRARATRDLRLVETQIANLHAEREKAMAGFAFAEGLLTRQAQEIREAMTVYDNKGKGGDEQTKLEAVR